MECKAEYSILGTDNLFALIGLNPCLINAIEIVMICSVFGVVNLAIYHAGSHIVTWVRWFKLKMSTQMQADPLIDSLPEPAETLGLDVDLTPLSLSTRRER